MNIATLSVLMLLVAAGGASAQGNAAEAMAKLSALLPPEAEERLALSAAPEHLRGGAAVYVYGKRGYERVQSGTNGFTCLVNRDAFLYGSGQFKPTCWDAQGGTTFVPVMLKVGEMLAARESAVASKNFRAPETGGVAYMLAGDVDPDTGRVTRQAFPGHYMFYANNATNAQLGFSVEAARKDPTLPSVFSAGAGGAHGLSYIIAMPAQTNVHVHSGSK